MTIFSDSLDAALEARAHGELAADPTGAMSHPDRRMNGPGGMVLDGNAVRSVDRAAALLLALGESQGEAGVTELARRLGLHKSTASRLLATLQKRGLVEQDDETGKYRLGLVVIRLAERAERTLDLRGIALPELERLARLTHETTGLGILEGDTMLAVAQVDGPNLIAVGDWTGRATPLHCVASGKVLLSSLAEREVLRIVRRGLVSYTERTIVELEPLLEELARIRRRGYATAIGEYELGLNAVAAPVHDARGNVIAAVDIWGPAFRLTPRRIPELATQAREAAAAITVRLGGTGAGTAHAGPRHGLTARRHASARRHAAARRRARLSGDARLRHGSPGPTSCRSSARRCCPSCSSSSWPSSRCAWRACSSTAWSRRCSIARRPRAPRRSSARSSSRSGWTRSTRSAPTRSSSSSSSSPG